MGQSIEFMDIEIYDMCVGLCREFLPKMLSDQGSCRYHPLILTTIYISWVSWHHFRVTPNRNGPSATISPPKGMNAKSAHAASGRSHKTPATFCRFALDKLSQNGDPPLLF